MRVAAIVVMAVFLVAAPILVGGPLRPFGDEKGYHRIQIEPWGVRVFSEPLAARERSCVIAIGQGVSPVAVYVYDPHGNCVAWDDVSLYHVTDDVAAAWYPPREQRYEIEVRNQGRRLNAVEIAMH